MIIAPTKDPDSTIDYGHDWSDWLAGDTIVSSTWAVTPSGITVSDNSFTASATVVWLAGGVAGTTYRVKNTITTAAGRIEQATLLVTADEH